jgi:hypothetical protein
MDVDMTGTSWEEFAIEWQNYPDESHLLDGGVVKIALSAFVRNDVANKKMEVVWSCARGYYDDFVQPRKNLASPTLALEWLDIVQQEPGGLFSITGIAICGGATEHNVDERCEVAIEFLLGAIHERWSAECCDTCAKRFSQYAPTRTEVMARLQNEEWLV